MKTVKYMYLSIQSCWSWISFYDPTIIITIIIKNEKLRVTLCKNAAAVM